MKEVRNEECHLRQHSIGVLRKCLEKEVAGENEFYKWPDESTFSENTDCVKILNKQCFKEFIQHAKDISFSHLITLTFHAGLRHVISKTLLYEYARAYMLHLNVRIYGDGYFGRNDKISAVGIMDYSDIDGYRLHILLESCQYDVMEIDGYEDVFVDEWRDLFKLTGGATIQKINTSMNADMEFISTSFNEIIDSEWYWFRNPYLVYYPDS